MRIAFALLLATAAAGCGDDDLGSGRRDSGPADMDSGPRPDGGPGDLGDCGGEREECCRGTLCEPGLTCRAGSCSAAAACGHKDQPCCSGGACETGTVCQADICVEAEDCGTERA